jgi:hypothetical protein
MPAKFSAYLTIYNDWEFLEKALRSIAPYVDELVVVDGAYEWMAPHLSAMGHDLERSDPRVHDIVAASGIPFRIITGVWVNQIEKRIAGYRACTGRYICRIDSDEILFFDEKELERFFYLNGAVGQVEMPTYIAPGWIRGVAPRPPLRGRRAKLRAFFRPPRQQGLPRQSFLFDRYRVEPEIHMNYLWIVRDSDKRLHATEKPFRAYPRPIGFNAHLTIWRGIPHSVLRAESYVLNYILRFGAPWLPELKDRPVPDLRALFEIVPPQMFREIVTASRLGMNNMLTGAVIMAPSPLTPEQQSVFAGCYDGLLAGHAKLNRQMADAGLHYTPGLPPVIDISDASCTEAIAPDGVLLIEFESDVLNADVQMRSLIPCSPWQVAAALEPKMAGRFLAVRLPPPEGGWNVIVRREIELKIRTKSAAAIQRFKIRNDRPLPPGLSEI